MTNFIYLILIQCVLFSSRTRSLKRKKGSGCLLCKQPNPNNIFIHNINRNILLIVITIVRLWSNILIWFLKRNFISVSGETFDTVYIGYDRIYRISYQIIGCSWCYINLSITNCKPHWLGMNAVRSPIISHFCVFTICIDQSETYSEIIITN